MSFTPRFARRGNHSSASPLAWVESFVCRKCKCVLRERVVHAGCAATVADIEPDLRSSASSAVKPIQP